MVEGQTSTTFLECNALCEINKASTINSGAGKGDGSGITFLGSDCC